MTYASDLLDSLRRDFGAGTIITQTTNIGIGSIVHDYAAAGSYTVTLEQWGVENIPANPTPFYCTWSNTNEVYNTFTDSLCGGSFLTLISGNTVTFSNTSVIHAPGFNSHTTEPLWDFGNGVEGGFINRINQVTYSPGAYIACLYYGGFSFNDGGYFYDCETCSTFTVGQSLDLRQIEKFQPVIYPNPAEGDIIVRFNGDIKISQIDVNDLTGRPFEISVLKMDDHSVKLSTTQLAREFIV